MKILKKFTSKLSKVLEIGLKYPETKAGGDRRSKNQNRFSIGFGLETFTKDIAKKLNINQTTISELRKKIMENKENLIFNNFSPFLYNIWITKKVIKLNILALSLKYGFQYFLYFGNWKFRIILLWLIFLYYLQSIT